MNPSVLEFQGDVYTAQNVNEPSEETIFFRFLTIESGSPAIAEAVTFTLLDVFGDPIEGATSVDVWNGCFQGAPQNVAGTFASGQHIDVSWDPVATASGFDPPSGVGFYQIGIEDRYGATTDNGTTTHLIPWNPFAPGSPGQPDGIDFGLSLSELDDGIFGIDVIAFAEDVGPGGRGTACQVRDDPIFFEKLGTDITIPVPAP